MPGPAFNPRQKAAIEHGRGPMLVVAGAGTGKTTVLTERVARLIQKKLAPGSISSKALHHLLLPEATTLFQGVLAELNKVWEYNRSHPDAQVGIDGQLSNWAIDGFDPYHPSLPDLLTLFYIDTSTPLFRRGGAERARAGELRGRDDDDEQEEQLERMRHLRLSALGSRPVRLWAAGSGLLALGSRPVRLWGFRLWALGPSGSGLSALVSSLWALGLSGSGAFGSGLLARQALGCRLWSLGSALWAVG